MLSVSCVARTVLLIWYIGILTQVFLQPSARCLKFRVAPSARFVLNTTARVFAMKYMMVKCPGWPHRMQSHAGRGMLVVYSSSLVCEFGEPGLSVQIEVIFLVFPQLQICS